MIEKIKEAWGWTGADPMEIVTTNAFGNIIFKDPDGKFWRLCPEDTYCEVIAQSQKEYDALLKEEEFIVDWEMELLVHAAFRSVGSLGTGEKYCQKNRAFLAATTLRATWPRHPGAN